MANALVEWGGSKPSITYGPEENRARVLIEPVSSLRVGKEPYVGSEASEDERDNDKGRLVGHAQPSKEGTPLMRIELHSLGSNLYHWGDDGEYGNG
jgi:hypothetical protein